MTHLSQGRPPEGGKRGTRKYAERRNGIKTTAAEVQGGDVSPCRFSYTEVKMNTIGTIYVG